jgi:hypothetical protein
MNRAIIYPSIQYAPGYLRAIRDFDVGPMVTVADALRSQTVSALYVSLVHTGIFWPVVLHPMNMGEQLGTTSLVEKKRSDLQKRQTFRDAVNTEQR